MVGKSRVIIAFLIFLFSESIDAQTLQLEQEIVFQREAGNTEIFIQLPFIKQRFITGFTGQALGSINNAETPNFFDFENDGVPEILFNQIVYGPGGSKIKIFDGATAKLKHTVTVDSADIKMNEEGMCAGFLDVDGDGVRELAGEFFCHLEYGDPSIRATNRLLFIDVRNNRVKYSIQGYHSYLAPDGYEGYAFYDIDNDSYPEVLCRWHNSDTTTQKIILRIYGNGKSIAKQSPQNVAKKLFPTINSIPNPFNGSTKIEYYVTNKDDNVMLDIFNLDGKIVRTLVNKRQKMGEYTLLWDGKNENGQKLAAGEYYFRLKVGDFISTKKTISIK